MTVSAVVPEPRVRSTAPAPPLTPPATTTIETAPEPPPLGDADLQVIGEKFTTLTARVVPYGQAQNVGLYVESMAPGVFAESLARNDRVPLLWAHQHDALPIGVSEAWQESSDGLYARFRLSKTAWAQAIARDVRDLPGSIGVSVGFQPEISRWEFAPVFDPDNGKWDRVVRQRARLLEVSATPTPAYVGAVIVGVESVPLAATSRSYFLNARHEHESRRLLRDHDRDLARRAARQAELDAWRDYRESIRRR